MKRWTNPCNHLSLPEAAWANNAHHDFISVIILFLTFNLFEVHECFAMISLLASQRVRHSLPIFTSLRSSSLSRSFQPHSFEQLCQTGSGYLSLSLISEIPLSFPFLNIRIIKMLSLSAYASVLCTIAALSNAQRPHYHQWNHYAPPGAVSLSSTASTAPSATASVAAVELDSSSDPSPVAGSSVSSSISGTAPSSAVSGTGSSSDSISSSGLTPNNNKAGVAGFKNIQITYKAALAQYAPYISWYSDYWPNTPDFPSGDYTVKGIGMVSPQILNPSFSTCCPYIQALTTP